MQKILGLRTGRSLRSQIDSVDDLRTSKRCRPNDEEADWRTGLQDALEIGNTARNYRLGFDESEHIGQKKAPRDGGYPDIRVKASTMQTCGFADTKATSRYGMDTNDTNKLSLYYKDCWAEFPDQAPSSFFMYIAGGFDGKDAASVLNTLERCTQKYGRPVCAITVNAMLRLVRMNNRPGPEALVRAFSQRAYYRSVESIIQASAP